MQDWVEEEDNCRGSKTIYRNYAISRIIWVLYCMYEVKPHTGTCVYLIEFRYFAACDRTDIKTCHAAFSVTHIEHHCVNKEVEA